MLAVRHSQKQTYPLAEFLLECGVNINQQNRQGITALMRGHDIFGIFEFLLKRGADWSIKNNQGETVLDFLMAANASPLSDTDQEPVVNLNILRTYIAKTDKENLGMIIPKAEFSALTPRL